VFRERRRNVGSQEFESSVVLGTFFRGRSCRERSWIIAGVLANRNLGNAVTVSMWDWEGPFVFGRNAAGGGLGPKAAGTKKPTRWGGLKFGSP